jgi:hypothetical protein
MPEIRPRRGRTQGGTVRREAGPAERAGTDLAGIGEALRSRRGNPPGDELEGTMLGMVILSFLDLFWWLRR